MKALVIYDTATSALLEDLYATLSMYTDELEPLLAVTTRGMTCSRDIDECFDRDHGKCVIEHEIKKVKEKATPVRIDIAFELDDLIIKLGKIHGLSPRRRHHYEYEIKPYSYNKLNEQALRLPFIHVDTFLDGELSEVEFIAKRFNIEELHTFFDDIYEGDLSDKVYVRRRVR
jgi:hypothetical protein